MEKFTRVNLLFNLVLEGKKKKKKKRHALEYNLGRRSDGEPKSPFVRGDKAASAELDRHRLIAYLDPVILQERYYPHLNLQQREPHAWKVLRNRHNASRLRLLNCRVNEFQARLIKSGPGGGGGGALHKTRAYGTLSRSSSSAAA